MSFFESDYTPTDADLQDWIHVLKLRWLLYYGMNEAENLAQGPEPGPGEEEEYYPEPWDIGHRVYPTSYPSYLDHEGESWVGNEEDDDMDGDATSALESVYGPEDYYPEYDYDDGWCDFEDNGEGFVR